MNGHQQQRENSRRMIETALFELMEEKEYAQITVSEIGQRADVARRTFYRLYEGKEDVLHGYFRRLCQEYCSSYAPLGDYHIEQIAAEYFGFWYQYRELLLLMHRHDMEDMLYSEIRRASLEVVKSRIDSEAFRRTPGLEYFADYSTGGFLNLLHRWADEGMREPPEKYAKKVSEAILKFVGTAITPEERPCSVQVPMFKNR